MGGFGLAAADERLGRLSGCHERWGDRRAVTQRQRVALQAAETGHRASCGVRPEWVETNCADRRTFHRRAGSTDPLGRSALRRRADAPSRVMQTSNPGPSGPGVTTLIQQREFSRGEDPVNSSTRNGGWARVCGVALLIEELLND